MADETLIIDDRRTNGLVSRLGNNWRIVTDNVMGGRSSGELSPATVENKACLCLSGDVSLANSGGFIQAALDIKALYMGLTGVDWSQTGMAHVAARYLGGRPLTHNALRDAQDQAELFVKMVRG